MVSSEGGAPRLEWREIVSAKTMALVPDWFADLPPYQRARVRWAFADPEGAPNEPNLVSGSKYESLALRYTSLDGPVVRPKGGYGSMAHGIGALPDAALAATNLETEEWLPASQVEAVPLHLLFTTNAHSESRIRPAGTRQRQLVSTASRGSAARCRGAQRGGPALRGARGEGNVWAVAGGGIGVCALVHYAAEAEGRRCERRAWPAEDRCGRGAVMGEARVVGPGPLGVGRACMEGRGGCGTARGGGRSG
jgi:hypothetical protein